MASHMLTYLDQNVNVADSPAAKLITIAGECYKTIWHAHEWTMRYSGTAVTWEPGEETTIPLLTVPALVDDDEIAALRFMEEKIALLETLGSHLPDERFSFGPVCRYLKSAFQDRA